MIPRVRVAVCRGLPKAQPVPVPVTPVTPNPRVFPTRAQPYPEENNGYFDSCALDRWHTEIWEENGGVFINDTRSLYGMFINGKRHSPVKSESKLYQLKSHDVIVFRTGLAIKASEKLVFCIFPMVLLIQDHHQSCVFSNSTTAASYMYNQHVPLPHPLNSANCQRGCRAGCKIQEQHAAEHDPQIYIPILMCAVKYLASLVVPISALAKQPVWDLESLDHILQGHTDIPILELSHVSILLQHLYPSTS